jgi:hypothetical protein
VRYPFSEKVDCFRLMLVCALRVLGVARVGACRVLETKICFIFCHSSTARNKLLKSLVLCFPFPCFSARVGE